MLYCLSLKEIEETKKKSSKSGTRLLFEMNQTKVLSFLFQAISMEVQRGNCASVLGTVESPKLLQELFNLLDTKPDSHSA